MNNMSKMIAIPAEEVIFMVVFGLGKFFMLR